MVVVCITWFHSSPVQGKESVLHIGTVNPPTSLNFFGATDLWSGRILRLFHMPLYVRGPQQDRPRAWLAAAPPRTVPNGVIIPLRDAKWDDGTPVTAHDLAFTIGVIQEFRVPGLVEKWEDVKGIHVVGPKRIRLVLSHPSPDFFSRALRTGFVQKRAWQEVIQAARKAEDGLRFLLSHHPDHVVSNGPFYLSTDGTPYFLVLKRNPFFFDPSLDIGGIKEDFSLQGITLLFYRDYRTMVRDFEQGKTDFLWSDLTEVQGRQLLASPHVVIHRTPRTGYDYLGFNLKRSPFDDLAFRKAVSLLVDRERIIQHILKGYAEPVFSVIPPHNTAWHRADIGGLGTDLSTAQRVEKARAILREAGYGWHQGTLLLPHGSPMAPMEILTTGNGAMAFRTRVVMILKKELLKIGVRVHPVILNLKALLAALKEGDFDAYLLGWASLPEDPGYLRTFFHTREARTGGKNYVRFHDETFDRLMEQASQEMDPDKRKKIIYQVQSLLAEKRPYIPLYAATRAEATRSDRYRGWVALPGGVGNLWSFLNIKPVH